MKRTFKIWLVALFMMLTTVFCSSCLTATSVVLVEEKRRENHRMDCELVGTPQMTFVKNSEGMYEVTVDFILKNNGTEDCYDWNCTVSVYDENHCLLDAIQISRHPDFERGKILKMGEETSIQIENLTTHYAPVSVRVWDICIYASYQSIIR